MTKHYAAPLRGRILGVRADASDPKAILNELKTTFAAFRSENDDRLKALEKGRADVVTTDKVDRINSALGEMQAALDIHAQKMAHLEIGGGGANKPVDAEYTGAFEAFARRGEIKAALDKGTGANGGYIAPAEWDRTITDKLVLVSPMRALCSVQPISVSGFSKLFNNRGTVSGWVGETAARATTATPTFGTVAYTPGEIYAKPIISQQLLDDGQIDVEQWLAGEVDAEFAFQEGTAFLTGDGVAKPTGVLTYVTGAANAAAHPFGAIGVINSGHATQLTADGIIDLVYALPSDYTGNATFAMNRKTQNAARKLKDTTNNYLWQPSLAIGAPATLCGFPVKEMPGMPDIAAAAKAMLFGDFKRGYLIVDRKGINVTRDPYSNKPYVEFYTTKRVGGGALNTEAFKALNISV